jgi:hypothetical protein
MRGNTLLMRRDEIHGNEPLNERNLRILKDCANKDRKVPSTVWATILSILASLAMVSTAIGAYNVTIRPS